jgi:hypothetical protein
VTEEIQRDDAEPEDGPGVVGPLTPHMRELLAELESWLLGQPDALLADYALVPATRWVLEDIPGLDLARYDDEARVFVVATPIWDRVLLRYQHDITYWMSQRLMMNENHEPEPERARELLENARAVIAERADLLEREGFERTAQSFRALLDASAGGEPPTDVIWKALGLRIAEPYLQDPANPETGAMTPYQPPAEQPGHEPE